MSTSSDSNIRKDIVQDFFENFDLKLFMYVSRRTFLVVLTLFILSLLIPYLYARYTTPIFETKATMIKKKEYNNAILDEKNTDFLKSNDEEKINRDIQIIKSDMLLDYVVDSLGLNVQYFKKGRLPWKRFEQNPANSFYLSNYTIYTNELYNQDIEIDFDNEKNYTIRYTKNGKEVEVEHLKPGIAYKNEDIQLQIQLTNENINGIYLLVFNSKENIKKYIVSNLNVSNGSPNIYFDIKSANPKKSEWVLSKILHGFLQVDQRENAERVENSINYIKGFIDTVNLQVRKSQREQVDYVTKNAAYDPKSQLQSNISEINEYKSAIIELESRVNLLQRTQREISFQPSTKADLSYAHDDKELASLLAERTKLLIDYKPSHPTIGIVDRQIQDRIKSIQQSLKFQIEDFTSKLGKFQAQKSEAVSSMSSFPEKNMELNKIQNELEIKEKYVLDLMEKQIQYLILKSSISSDYLIIQPPKTQDSQIYPRKGLAYTAGIITFILLSFLLIIYRYINFDKLVSIEEIKRKTNVPILGYIPYVEEALNDKILNQKSPESRLVVLENFKSRISEVFKKIRASLKYTSHGNYKTVCATSTISGEGKTFILINLAAVHALMDKKVLIIDLDLRKPRIAKSFKLSNIIGMSNLLSDDSVSIDDCIQKGIQLDNLDIISSGPIPPNPSELITSKRFDIVLEELKNKYDYIFIDTPPVGLVNESIDIVNKVDIPLYILKLNFSKKEFIEILNDTNKLKKTSNLYLVINHYGEGAAGYVNYNYGYGYTYGYGSRGGYSYHGGNNGYYTESVLEFKKTAFTQKLKNMFSWKL